ncbi:lon protease homolog 2, peroxisomal-like isoform X2 [Cimex lectularius]|nr:lon protease homolog 2, peroxisomal-like isoform X2 [Cimex lectularius]
MIKVKLPKKVGLIFSDTVLLPGMSKKIVISSEDNIKTLKYYMESEDDDYILGFIPSKNEEVIKEKGMIGSLGYVKNVYTSQNGESKLHVVVVGICRFKVASLAGEVKVPIIIVKDLIVKETTESIENWQTLVSNIPRILKKQLAFEGAAHFGLASHTRIMLIDACADIVATTFEDRVDILISLDPLERLKKTVALIEKYEDDTVKMQYPAIMGSNMPLPGGGSYIINGGPRNSNVKDIKDLRERLKAVNLPEAASKVAEQELAKLERMSTNNPEHVVIHSYLDLILSLPWSVSSTKEINISEARKTLDKDHYALMQVKKRVLEYLAVKRLKKDNLNAPILCFVGPPGVGKTSVGRSIANIMGRKFQRICLGGVSNPSVIRGHRKAYVGAMCGRIIQALKNAGENNPVILFDEIDKLGFGTQGDPSSALLEVLDPEQNRHFVDHYLNIPFDLSQIVFLATANTIKTIQPALVDRMEVIEVSGYTTEEKCQIVKSYLLPKQIDMHGLKPEYFHLPDESIEYLIRRYTLESGVRNAERNIAAVCRSVALTVADSNTHEDIFPIVIDQDKIIEILGREKFSETSLEDCLAGVMSGVAVGLSYTPVGGAIIIIEARQFPYGKGELLLTGRVGKVLSESAKIALNWVRANAAM